MLDARLEGGCSRPIPNQALDVHLRSGLFWEHLYGHWDGKATSTLVLRCSLLLQPVLHILLSIECAFENIEPAGCRCDSDEHSIYGARR